jgi:hypothetical protein
MPWQTKKWSELDEIGREQEGKFKHYVSGIYFSVLGFVRIIMLDLLSHVF